MEDIEDKAARVRRLSELVHGLPKVNYELLRIMSRHLKGIVARSQENKMTIRNGTVRIPTWLTSSRYCLFTYPEYPSADFFTFHLGIRICFR